MDADPSDFGRRARVLVQLVTLADQGRWFERPAYAAVEDAAVTLARRHLRGHYVRRMLLRGAEASSSRLVAALVAATATPGVAAVDLLLQPHGTSRRLLLAGGGVDTADLARDIRRAIPAERAGSLRAVFSTACYGSGHSHDWLSAGFAVAMGARGIYADGLTSVPALLAAWAAGATVVDAAEAANASDPWGIQDAAAAAYYRVTGRAAMAGEVDSRREVSGAAGLVMTSRPRG
jgi:hypothetical protein